jgi:hypothetical protein
MPDDPDDARDLEVFASGGDLVGDMVGDRVGECVGSIESSAPFVAMMSSW